VHGHSAELPPMTPDESSPVVVKRLGAVSTIRLNRPNSLNSLNVVLKVALRDAVLEAAADDTVRAVVLTGTGRGFCAGQDLREHIGLLESGSDLPLRTVTEHYNPTAIALATMNKPVIAAVNGVAAGAGASFVFAADIRLVAASAGFNLAFTQVGLSADSGASWWLPRLVGHTRAMDLLLNPRTISAQQALDWGIATEIVADDELSSRAAEIAARLADGPTVAFGAVRRAVSYSATHDLADSLAHESTLMDLTGASADHQAAVTAFVTKTPPVFTGH
jgi:2-(1,2-epoxy-1,2-dihydrophenyl)acetyl-CoA isomerase